MKDWHRVMVLTFFCLVGIVHILDIMGMLNGGRCIITIPIGIGLGYYIVGPLTDREESDR